MSKEELQRTTLEIAMLGAQGFSVNDPSKKYQLRSLPGNFTVGFKIIDPTVNIGFDIATEYAEAQRKLLGER